MKSKRLKRVSSLLKEVISEVIQKELYDPNLRSIFSITSVDIAPDLHTAKVFVGILGKKEEKQKTLQILQDAAGFISMHASKKVTIRYFPTLTFLLDTSLEKHIKIEKILHVIHEEQEKRLSDSERKNISS